MYMMAYYKPRHNVPLVVSKRLVSGMPLCLVLCRVWVKPVDGTTDTSQAVNDVTNSDSLCVPVLDVDDAISNDACEKGFEDFS